MRFIEGNQTLKSILSKLSAVQAITEVAFSTARKLIWVWSNLSRKETFCRLTFAASPWVDRVLEPLNSHSFFVKGVSTSSGFHMNIVSLLHEAAPPVWRLLNLQLTAKSQQVFLGWTCLSQTWKMLLKLLLPYSTVHPSFLESKVKKSRKFLIQMVWVVFVSCHHFLSQSKTLESDPSAAVSPYHERTRLFETETWG